MTPDRWQACLDRLQSTGRLPSVVGGVLLGGELLWSGGSGDVPGGPGQEPADVQYRIGSITKTLVAVAVLRCHEEGLLSLDDPVGRFVPESGYADATVRSLLAHTSGMQSEPVGSWWERSPGIDTAALLAANDGSGAVSAAGEYHHYSNLGFALLGEAVARIRGAGWWEVVNETILGPLEMTRTTYDPVAPFAQGYSVAHFAGTLTREPHQDTGAMAPAGQAWSTIADLARWGRFLASGHPDVLDEQHLREAARPAPPAPEYGLGLRLLPWNGRHLVGHTGSMPGFLASLFVDPATGDGSVVMANATTGLHTDAVPSLMLGAVDVDSPPAWVPTSEVPAEVADLLGVWFWGNTAFELRWQEDAAGSRLEVHSLALQNRQDAFEVRDGRIVGVDGYHRGETLHVVRREDGSVSHLDCATFVYTRMPYDRTVPIPGGHPD